MADKLATGQVVYSVPWGLHSGEDAAIESACGQKQLEEAAALIAPVSAMLPALRSPRPAEAMGALFGQRTTIEPPVEFDLDPS